MNKEVNKDYYFIEGVADNDLIGFESYLYSLDSAINNGAKFIGLVSDYGTGKSTLINLFKNRNKKDKFITINLWNCDNQNKTNTIDIHKIFLHQLIDKLDIDKKEYFKKKINKNYSAFDIVFKDDKKYLTISLLFIYVLCIFDKLGFVKIFSEDLKLFYYLAIAILTVLCLFIFKPILLSYKKDNTINEIDENDTKDLYKEILDEYYCKLNGDNVINLKEDDSKLIICLEELDRYDNIDSVLKYLKEFYKFYKEAYNKKIVFIVSIKSAGELYNSVKNNPKYKVNDIKNIYEKIFDYILNLMPINIQDYDYVVLDLINQKKNSNNLPEGIKVPKKDSLNNWRYLYTGNNVKIRDIKHRYNFAISIYLSVKESGLEKVNFNKCLFIAYLEDEYNELYEALIHTNNLLNDILIAYTKNTRDFSYLFTDEVFEDKNIKDKNIKDKNIKDNYNKILLEGLDSKFISIDYNYYFYKFPKNKPSYSIYEYNLYNAIFYDDDKINLTYALTKLEEKQIINILSKRANNTFIPKIVFSYPKLLLTAHNNEYTAYMNTVSKQFNIINNFDQFVEYISNIRNLNNKNYRKLLTEYFNVYMPIIKELNLEDRTILRKRIVKVLGSDSVVIKDLYDNNNEIISTEEISYISDINTIYNLTNLSLITDDTISNYIKIINNGSKTLILKILKVISLNNNISNEAYKNLLYSIDFNKYNFNEKDYISILSYSKERLELNIPKNYSNFLNKINYYSEYFDAWYLKILNIGIEDEVIEYEKTLNKFNTIYKTSMEVLDKYAIEGDVFPFNKNIREEFYKNKYYNYYVISTKLSDNIFEIEDDKFANLSKQYIIEYEYRKKWTWKVGPKMKEYLYKNVNMSRLNSQRLILFNDMIQTKEIVKAVLNTDDSKFINSYLSKITKLNTRDTYEIYKLIGDYNKENKILKPNAKANLKALTNNDMFKKLLDARRKTDKVLNK